MGWEIRIRGYQSWERPWGDLSPWGSFQGCQGEGEEVEPPTPCQLSLKQGSLLSALHTGFPGNHLNKAHHAFKKLINPYKVQLYCVQTQSINTEQLLYRAPCWALEGKRSKCSLRPLELRSRPETFRDLSKVTQIMSSGTGSRTKASDGPP